MSYYFQHDYDAMSDDKLLQLRSEYGLAGYGVFWMCLETMAKNEDGYIIATLIGGLSVGYGIVEKGWLESFLEYCVRIGLFKFDKRYGYFSVRMMENKEWRNSCKVRGKMGSDKRWKNSPAIATPLAKNSIEDNRIEDKIREPDSEGESVAIAPTPSQMASQFFLSLDSQEELVTRFKEKGYEEGMVRKEIKSFVSYWTEPNSTGKRQRWQMEKTFELSRRMSTWLGKAGNRQQSFIKPSQQWHAI